MLFYEILYSLKFDKQILNIFSHFASYSDFQFADDIDLYLKNHINGTGFYVGGIPSSGEGEFKINTTKLYEIVELKGNFLEIVIYEISVEAFYRIFFY